jgi:two-component system, sensor histidine kinase
LRIHPIQKSTIQRLLIVAIVLLVSFSVIPVAHAQEASLNFDHLFEHHGSVMLIIETDSGKILHANDAAAAFYGYSIQELESMYIHEINKMDPDDVEAERRAAAHEERNYFIFEHLLANGETRTVEVYSYPYVHENTDLLFSIIQDITPRIVAEQQLQNRTHFWLLTLATAAFLLLVNYLLVMNRKKVLLAAKIKAEEANQAKSNFLSNMTHELRSPLQGIMGANQLLGTTELDEEQTEYVDISMQASETLLTIVNDILDYTKIESDYLELEKAPLDLHSMAKDLIDLTRVTANQKGITLSYHLDPDIPDELLGDPFRIRQILTNLLSNAVKYTDQGSVDMRIEYLEGSSGRNRILFKVQDTGRGIPQEELHRVFERFYQIGEINTDNNSGTGLGLPISKGLAELMNGKIWVESQGKGSTFFFECELESPQDESCQPGACRDTCCI